MSLSESQTFWACLSNGMPSGSSEFVFLANAVHDFGHALYGEQRTGEEPLNLTIAQQRELDYRQDSAVYDLARAICGEQWADKRPRKPTIEQERNPQAAGLSILSRDFRWFAAVKHRIKEFAEGGDLITAVRPIEGGPMRILGREAWNFDDPGRRFDFCQMDPDNPFAPGNRGPGYQWIYVEPKSLDACLSKLRTGSAAANAIDRTSKSSALKACYDYLVEKMKQSPGRRMIDGKPVTKDQIYDHCRPQFGPELSRRGFDSEWHNAVKETGSAWSGPSAPSKNPRNESPH